MENRELTEDSRLLFLALIRAALCGGKAELPARADWACVIRLARQQHVLPMILDAAWQSDVPESLLAPVQDAGVRIVMMQARRTAAFLRLYRFLSAQNIFPRVLKGLVCRSLYPDPDKRPSSDEDLLIEPTAFSAVHEALLRYGLRCDCDDPSEELSKITYTSRDLRIELHLSPFPPESAAYGDLNALFEGLHERVGSLAVGEDMIYTLSPTDHLLYLICHAYKHFLHSGVGVRQVCDIALFADHYDAEIDWRHIRASCEQVRIARFTAAMFAIASRHLGFSMPAAFGDLLADESPMLTDMLSGGVYGTAEENRQHSATITLNAVTKQQGKTRTGLLSSVFLPLENMKRKYPYLKKYPWLLPTAWVQRVGQYLSRVENNVSPAESVRIGNERVALLREYGIID